MKICPDCELADDCRQFLCYVIKCNTFPIVHMPNYTLLITSEKTPDIVARGGPSSEVALWASNRWVPGTLPGRA